ncbi:hypothetical protein N9181_01225 [bacterium]|nr:hypothetical protein [bacterium]
MFNTQGQRNGGGSRRYRLGEMQSSLGLSMGPFCHTSGAVGICIGVEAADSCYSQSFVSNRTIRSGERERIACPVSMSKAGCRAICVSLFANSMVEGAFNVT